MDSDNSNEAVTPVEDSKPGEELGSWGVPESLEDNIDRDAGFPGGVGMPGVYSGEATEEDTLAAPDDQEPQS